MQEGKRNATPQDMAYSRGKLYDRRKKKQGAPEGNSNAGKQSPHFEDFESAGKTSESVAAESGVSKATAERDAGYSRAVDALTKVFGLGGLGIKFVKLENLRHTVINC